MTHRIAPDLIWRILDGNVVVVSPNTGKVRVLNDMGTIIWQLLVEQSSVDEIQKYLITHYEVPQEQASNDLEHFLSDLKMRGLLVNSG